MLFQKFTAGEFPVRSCRSALQARITAESRSYSKMFSNDWVNTVQYLLAERSYGFQTPPNITAMTSCCLFSRNRTVFCEQSVQYMQCVNRIRRS